MLTMTTRKIANGIASGAHERGQALMEFAIAFVPVMLAISLAVDLGLANAQLARQTEVLQQAEANCSLPATALIVKNSNQPARDMCAALIKELRDAGYNGDIEAYYYEPDRATSGLPVSQRVYIYGAKIESETRTLLSIGQQTHIIPTTVCEWESSLLAAPQQTYIPSRLLSAQTMPEAGISHASAGEDTGHYRDVTALTEDLMPGGQRALDKVLEQARRQR